MNALKETLREWTLELGKVDASGRGRKTNRATLDVELRTRASCSPHLDIDLTPCEVYTELSICGSVWNAAGTDVSIGGQCREEFGAHFKNNQAVTRLCEIWARWHNNGLNSGTREQRAYLEDVREGRADYDADCKLLEKANLLTVTGGPEIPNAHGAAVRRNYKYGTAWLCEPLPADVEAEVVRLCGELSAKTAAQESEPKNFAEEHGIEIGCTRVDRNPNMDDASRDADHWQCVLTWKEKKGNDRWRNRFTVYFTKGSAHKGAEPTAIEVLGCLASDASGIDESFADWCANYGYDTDSRKAKKTYDTIKKQAANLKRFLGDGLFRALLEDSNG